MPVGRDRSTLVIAMLGRSRRSYVAIEPDRTSHGPCGARHAADAWCTGSPGSGEIVPLPGGCLVAAIAGAGRQKLWTR